MGQWVVQLNGKHLDNTTTFVRFAMGAGIAFTDAPYVDGGFLRWQGATQKIVVDSNGVVQSQVDVGEVQILNQPPDLGSPGPLDALAGLVWHHNLAQLYWCPDRVWANAVLVGQNQLMQPVANLSTDSAAGSVLRFPLRDPRSQLTSQFQQTKFLGNNAVYTPWGYEGDADLKGKPKPILYGVASNIPGVVVNRGLLVYQLADVAVNVLCARDGAIPLQPGTVRATIDSLLAATPAPGYYDYAMLSYGTYVKLGSPPRYKVTFDAAEGATSADRTHAQVWKRMRTERCGTPSINIDGPSVTAADALDSNEVGWWFPDETTCKTAIDGVLASFSGYEVKDVVTKKFHIAKLLAPSGDPTLNLVVVTPTTEKAANDRALMKLDRVQPSYLPDGIPAWRVNVQWGQNYTVMQPTDFAGNADSRLRDKFATQWRTESDSDFSLYALYVALNELTVPTGYQPGSDGVTCPHAVTEAARIRALYTADRPAYQATFKPELTDVVQAGDVMGLRYSMYGLQSGRSFRVLQAQDIVENGVRTATVILGLQDSTATPVLGTESGLIIETEDGHAISA